MKSLSDIRKMIAEIKQYTLNFRFEAGTSRGVMNSKDSWFIKLYDLKDPDRVGIGECGPLQGLSPDLEGDLAGEMRKCIEAVRGIESAKELDIEKQMPIEFPALRFAFETAKLDLMHGGKRIVLENEFSHSQQEIPINGLVWMGDKQLMLQRIREKIEAGFDCIKIKIGAINLEEELQLLKYIRSTYSAEDITIRLDANGAFHETQVMDVLDKLSAFDIHSIEQPIRAGNWEGMCKICKGSPIPIALDEELIGINGSRGKAALLDAVHPQYIILKPTLVGGLAESREWIKLAEEMKVGWWITSALESNIGLNAIAQFVAEYDLSIPQGLGTGQLFHNNIPSPLYIQKGRLGYNASASWDVSAIS